MRQTALDFQGMKDDELPCLRRSRRRRQSCAGWSRRSPRRTSGTSKSSPSRGSGKVSSVL